MLTIVAPLFQGFSSIPEMNPCEGTKPTDAVITDANGEVRNTSSSPQPSAPHTAPLPLARQVAATIPDYFDNTKCAEMIDTGFNIALPQAGMDVTADGVYGARRSPHRPACPSPLPPANPPCSTARGRTTPT